MDEDAGLTVDVDAGLTVDEDAWEVVIAELARAGAPDMVTGATPSVSCVAPPFGRLSEVSDGAAAGSTRNWLLS